MSLNGYWFTNNKSFKRKSEDRLLDCCFINIDMIKTLAKYPCEAVIN